MKTLLLFFMALYGSLVAAAQPAATKIAQDSMLITVILKHQQEKNLKEIQEIQKANKYWELFPPKEARVVSWYAVMGLGQVITLLISPRDIRTLNLSLANGAWGAFSTEFYPAYDYIPIWQEHQKEMSKQKNP